MRPPYVYHSYKSSLKPIPNNALRRLQSFCTHSNWVHKMFINILCTQYRLVIIYALAAVTAFPLPPVALPGCSMSRLPRKFVFEPQEVGRLSLHQSLCSTVDAVRLGFVHPTLVRTPQGLVASTPRVSRLGHADRYLQSWAIPRHPVRSNGPTVPRTVWRPRGEWLAQRADQRGGVGAIHGAMGVSRPLPSPMGWAGGMAGPLGLSIVVAGCSTARCCFPVHAGPGFVCGSSLSGPTGHATGPTGQSFPQPGSKALEVRRSPDDCVRPNGPTVPRFAWVKRRMVGPLGRPTWLWGPFFRVGKFQLPSRFTDGRDRPIQRPRIPLPGA